MPITSRNLQACFIKMGLIAIAIIFSEFKASVLNTLVQTCNERGLGVKFGSNW